MTITARRLTQSHAARSGLKVTLYSGLLAQVTMAVGEQHITAIITADAAKEMRLKPGERAAALIKSTEVMILRV